MKKLLSTLFIAFLITGIAGALSLTTLVNNWHLKFSNSLYKRNHPSKDIVIVAIDEQTFENKIAGLERFHDFSRSDYARVIKAISDGKPRVLGVDILFQNAEQGITGGMLSDAILELDRAESETEQQEKSLSFLNQFTDIHPADAALAQALDTISQSTLAAIASLNGFNGSSYTFTDAYKRFPYIVFDPNLERSAFVMLNVDDDTISRSVPLHFLNTDSNTTYSPFAVHIAEQFLNKEITVPEENGNLLINYFAAPFGFQMVSFGDVYAGKIDASIFKDKIVLLGPTAAEIHDNHFTPVSDGLAMPGVEIHANIIQTILDEAYLANQGVVSRIITSAVMALIAALLIAYLTVWLGALLTLLLAVGYVIAARQLYYQGLILNMIQPFLTLATTLVVMVIYRYFAELREKYKLHGALSHYVTPAVAAEVMKNPNMLSLGGQKREISVFFSDIANFTHISESMEPEALVTLINHYMDLMAHEIMNAGGTVDKFEGDAIMAFFGAPISSDQHALQVCDAALKCLALLPSIQKNWPNIDFRIGIASGPAIVGNMGSRDRFDYTAMGDTVNLGSRLEGVNKVYGSRIIVAENTYTLAKDHFAFRELDYVQVKGKDQPVRIFELWGRGYTSVQTQALTHFYNGIKLYRQAQFLDAQNSFRQVLNLIPGDGPSTAYIGRCDFYIKTPPPAGWNGVWVMQGK